MVFNKKILEQIKQEIKRNRTFFIAGHLKPDGDTVGTSLALASLLTRMGKRASVYSKDTIPDNLRFAPGCSKIKIRPKAKGRFDCAIILECSDFARMGNLIGFNQTDNVINIDHHAHFNHFGKINLINPKASSSAEQVYNLFKYLRKVPTKSEAECLYIGLITDTGKFQQANTTTSALEMAAELVGLGVKPTYMNDKLYASKTFSSLSLLGLALNRMKVDDCKKIAYLQITRDMYKSAHSSVLETDEIINYTMMVSGVLVGVLFREEESPNTVKISFRSRDAFDVNKVAKNFGGGGHKNASGCTFIGNITDAKRIVLAYLREAVSCDN
jgi:phosphoesterase RecJ-like protein